MKTQNERIEYISFKEVRVLIASVSESSNLKVDYVASYIINSDGQLKVDLYSGGPVVPRVPDAGHEAQIIVTQCFLETRSFEALLPTNATLFKGKVVKHSQYGTAKFTVLHHWNDGSASIIDLETDLVITAHRGSINPLEAQRPEVTVFDIGDRVIKSDGDYTFEGEIVSKFTKLSGDTRYVLENDQGMLHTCSDYGLTLYGVAPEGE